MISNAALYSKVALTKSPFILSFGLNTTGEVLPTIGAHHKCLTNIISLSCKDFKVLVIGLRIGKYLTYRTLLLLQITDPHIIQFIPIAEEVIVIQIGSNL